MQIRHRLSALCGDTVFLIWKKGWLHAFYAVMVSGVSLCPDCVCIVFVKASKWCTTHLDIRIFPSTRSSAIIHQPSAISTELKQTYDSIHSAARFHLNNLEDEYEHRIATIASCHHLLCMLLSQASRFGYICVCFLALQPFGWIQSQMAPKAVEAEGK